MKSMVWVWILVVPISSFACPQGYEPTDVPGVCMEKPIEVTNPTWVSDEKPPQSGLPVTERSDIKLIDAPSMTTEDEKADEEKLNADRDGKHAAGIH